MAIFNLKPKRKDQFNKAFSKLRSDLVTLGTAIEQELSSETRSEPHSPDDERELHAAKERLLSVADALNLKEPLFG